MSSTLEATLPAAPAPEPKAPARRRPSADVWVYLIITALVVGAWLLSRAELFKAGDDLGYWIGESRKMAYKTRYQPMEGLLEGQWQALSDATS